MCKHTWPIKLILIFMPELCIYLCECVRLNMTGTPLTTDINTCINSLWSKAQTQINWKMEFTQTPNSLGL